MSKNKSLSLSEENYLKAVYFLSKVSESESLVSTTDLSNRLKAKASSITDMVRKLHLKKLVIHKPYKGIRLTEEGSRQALRVIRKHRLWEVFLVEHLRFGWDEVHDVAEQLEHIKSDKLINNLDAFLGRPAYDPHGDPIPNEEGFINNDYTQLMSDCSKGQTGIIGRVKDSSSPFLQLIAQKNLRPNTSFEILSKEEYDGTIELKLSSGLVSISEKVATNLFVKTDSHD